MLITLTAMTPIHQGHKMGENNVAFVIILNSTLRFINLYFPFHILCSHNWIKAGDSLSSLIFRRFTILGEWAGARLSRQVSPHGWIFFQEIIIFHKPSFLFPQTLRLRPKVSKDTIIFMKIWPKMKMLCFVRRFCCKYLWWIFDFPHHFCRKKSL